MAIKNILPLLAKQIVSMIPYVGPIASTQIGGFNEEIYGCQDIKERKGSGNLPRLILPSE